MKANVSANEDKALRSQVNDFIQKMKDNLMAVRKDGSGVAHYDTEKMLCICQSKKTLSNIAIMCRRCCAKR